MENKSKGRLNLSWLITFVEFFFSFDAQQILFPSFLLFYENQFNFLKRKRVFSGQKFISAINFAFFSRSSDTKFEIETLKKIHSK